MVADKYFSLVKRLVGKMRMSQVPVPGFAMSLSGTDSLTAFKMAYDAACELGIPDRVLGVHYIDANRKKLSWFEAEIIPWLRKECPEATILVRTPLGGNHDQQRWADLHLLALNEIEGDEVRLREPGKNYWVVGTINATEWALGTYSALAKSCSLQPIRTLNKTTVLKICRYFDVPDIAIEMAQVPDCLCGRYEFAAENIELIDALLEHRFPDMLDFTTDGAIKLAKGLDYIRTTKQHNDFKIRTPYIV